MYYHDGAKTNVAICSDDRVEHSAKCHHCHYYCVCVPPPKPFGTNTHKILLARPCTSLHCVDDDRVFSHQLPKSTATAQSGRGASFAAQCLMAAAGCSGRNIGQVIASASQSNATTYAPKWYVCVCLCVLEQHPTLAPHFFQPSLSAIHLTAGRMEEMGHAIKALDGEMSHKQAT